MLYAVQTHSADNQRFDYLLAKIAGKLLEFCNLTPSVYRDGYFEHGIHFVAGRRKLEAHFEALQ